MKAQKQKNSQRAADPRPVKTVFAFPLAFPPAFAFL